MIRAIVGHIPVMDGDFGKVFGQVCLSPDNSILFAARIMSEYRAGTVVLKRGGAVVGVITEHLLRRCLAAGERDPETTPLSAIMARTPVGGTGVAAA